MTPALPFAQKVMQDRDGLTPVIYLFQDQDSGGIVPAHAGEVLSRADFEELIAALHRFYDNTTDAAITDINAATRTAMLNQRNQAIRKWPEKVHLRAQRRGVIYILKADNGLYKIGKTSNPNKRLPRLAIQLPYQITVVQTIWTDDIDDLESRLHLRFAAKRVQGEWFKLDAADLAALAQ